MTCIAWDGKTLAADKRVTNSGLGSTITKVFEVNGKIVAFSGDGDAAMEMLAWFSAGAKPEKFPARNRSEKDWALLVVVDKEGLRYYERTPYPIHNEDPFWACGAGRDYALAAMYLGKTAREAVEVACHFDISCGNGIDTMTL